MIFFKKRKTKLTLSLEMANLLLNSLGGKNNILVINNCVTRLRLEVKDSSLIDETLIKRTFSGLIKNGETSIQIIVGPIVESVAIELKKLVY